MNTHSERYLNLFTDFAFQKVFGNEQNKDLLLDFVNALPLKQGKVIHINFLKTDDNVTDHKTIIGAICENEKNEKFIIQLQKLKQNFFKERGIYYSTLPITTQAILEKNWDFDLKTVYSIALLDFGFDNHKSTDKHIQEIKLIDTETNQVFYDKLSFIYLQIPQFNKTLEQLNTRLDKWLFILKNFANLENVPESLKDKVFDKLFEIIDLKTLEGESLKHYEESLKYYRDLKNTLATAKAEGREEGVNTGIELGKQEEKIRVAKQLLKMGADIEMISEITDLKPAEIQALSKE